MKIKFQKKEKARKYQTKEERLAERQKIKEEKAEVKKKKKEKKRAEKEHKKEVELLNKKLCPVSKKTYESLGIISFDSDVATIRKDNNKWVKTYKIEGLNELNKNQFLDNLMEYISIRSRISSNFTIAENGKLIRTDYMTFFTDGEIYESVKLALDAEVRKINAIRPEINLVEISPNCFMNQIRRNFLHDGEELPFDGMTKRKYDWRLSAFNAIAVKDDYFEINNKTGVVMQIIQFPGEIDENVLKCLVEKGLPIMFITEIQPLDTIMMDDFRRVLEKRFNKEVEQSNAVFTNVGFTMVILTDSVDQKDEIIKDVEEIFSEHKIIISPVYGNTADVLESSFSYGIKDYHSMRNIEIKQVKKLVV